MAIWNQYLLRSTTGSVAGLLNRRRFAHEDCCQITRLWRDDIDVKANLRSPNCLLCRKPQALRHLIRRK